MIIQNKRKSGFFSKTNRSLGTRIIAMNAKGIVCVALVVAVLLGVLPMVTSAQYYSSNYGYSQPSYSNYGYSQPSYSNYGYSQPSYSNYGYSQPSYSGYQSQTRAYLDNFLTYYFNSGFPGPR